MADSYVPRLKTEYEKVIRPKLAEAFGYSNPFAIPRVHVTLRTTIPEFSAHLSGLHTRLQRAVGG